jgi:hypothetical protein
VDRKEDDKIHDWLAIDPILPGSIREKLARLNDKVRLLGRARWPARRQVHRRRVDRYLESYRTEERSEPD